MSGRYPGSELGEIDSNQTLAYLNIVGRVGIEVRSSRAYATELRWFTTWLNLKNDHRLFLFAINLAALTLCYNPTLFKPRISGGGSIRFAGMADQYQGDAQRTRRGKSQVISHAPFSTVRSLPTNLFESSPRSCFPETNPGTQTATQLRLKGEE